MTTFDNLVLVALVIVALYALLRKRRGEMNERGSIKKAVVERKNGRVTVKCPYCGYTIYSAKKTDSLSVHSSSKPIFRNFPTE